MVQTGIHLAMKPIYDRWSKQLDSFQLYLLNHSDHSFRYHIEAVGEQRDFFAYEGNLGKRDMLDLDILALTEFNRKVEVILILDNDKTYRINLKANKFRNQLIPIPIVEVDGYVFSFKTFAEGKSKHQLIEDKKEVISLDDIKSIKDAWNNQVRTSNVPKFSITDSEKIVDLHIEELNPNWENMPSSEMLSFQLNYMEEALDRAIADNHHSIIFIHGIGDGILKNAIFGKLKQHPHVKSFENRYDSRFGFGATEVIIK